MKKYTTKFAHGLLLIPFLTVGSPFAILNKTSAPVQIEVQSVSVLLSKERADKIDAYYKKRGMPLLGYGAKMIAEAEKNNLDWRLLPAIAIKESTGGKFACHKNPFGWGSCKIKFNNWNEAIEVVAWNLGGNNPNTARYYKGKTTIEKLSIYNSVIPTYNKEIFEFMDLIEKGK